MHGNSSNSDRMILVRPFLAKHLDTPELASGSNARAPCRGIVAWTELSLHPIAKRIAVRWPSHV